MNITTNSVYTTLSATTSPKQRQSASDATATVSSTTFASQMTASQAAYDRTKEETKSGATYDFTKIPPKQIWPIAQDLYESGKITKQQHLLMVSAAMPPLLSESGALTPQKADMDKFENTPINLIQYGKDRISFLESTGRTTDPQYGYKSWKDLLSTLLEMSSGNAA